MKNFVKFLSVVIVIVAIASLGYQLWVTETELHESEDTVKSLTLTEGEVVEKGSIGGTVVANLKDWVYYSDDEFIKSSSKATSIDQIFTDLFQKNLIVAYKDSLVKLSFTKEIKIKAGNTEKQYYLVGDYYISDSSTSATSK